MLTFGSLFAGIGGMDLGLERAGFHCVWQVEIDPWCRRVLAKHWPSVRKHDDVKTFPPGGDWKCDVIAGGFPCQPVAQGGKKLRQQDIRWLWPEFARVIRLLEPRFVLLENTPGLLDGGMDTVLGDLSAMGLHAEWTVLSACAFGAPHMRRRLFIVAYSDSGYGETRPRVFPVRQSENESRRHCQDSIPWNISTTGNPGITHGLPHRVDRVRGLGNAVVPQIAEWLGLQLINAIGKESLE